MKPVFLTVVACLISLMVIAPPARTQGVGSSGTINGTVHDPTGAIIPKATVVAIETDKGISHSAESDSTGFYRITGLPPAAYDVTVRATGFETTEQKGVVVSVGSITVADFHLTLATTKSVVEVNAAPPVVEVQRGSQADAVMQRDIQDLPIDRRDYLTFTLLMPGVSNSTVITDNADFRVKQTPQSGLSFYGSNGRGNSVTVDGGEANDDAGGVRLTVSQDAVQEFQINRSNYAADLGSASGASINIVSKSGTNELHGSLYAFFRNSSMDARYPFAFGPALAPGDPFSLDAVGEPIKNQLNRQQFGGTLGFPIKKDKTFLFVSYEGLRSDAQDASTILTNSNIFAPTAIQQPILAGLAGGGATPVPCLSGPVGAAVAEELGLPAPAPATFLPSALCAQVLGGSLTTAPTNSPFSNFVVNQFEANGGLFPFPIRSNQGFVRLDHRVDENNQVSLRYSFSHLTESDPDVQALTAFSRGTSQLAWDSTLTGSWTHSFSPTTQNELLLQWNWSQFNVTTNDPGGPGYDVEGFGFFGRQIFLPSFTTMRRYQIGDNLTLIRGHHVIKAGFGEVIRGNNTTSQTFFPGRFEFLQLPGDLLSPCLQTPIACGLGSASAPISTLQAWGFGVPAFFEQGFGNPQYAYNRPFTSLYVQDSWLIRSNLTLNYGLRYELDSQNGPIATPTKNFAPRFSFAWDPFKDHKTVVRGGYGIFYSPIYAQIDNVVKTLGNVNGTRQIANTLVTLLGTNGDPSQTPPVPPNPNQNSALIYQVLFAEGVFPCTTLPAGSPACISREALAQPLIGINVPNTGPLPPGTVLFTAQPHYKSPYSQQASLGIEREITNGLSVSLSYIYVHTLRLPVAIDRNLLAGAPIVTGTGADGLPTNGRPFQDWGAPACVNAFGQPASTTCFANPQILQNNFYSSIGPAIYQGGIIELKKRFSNHFSLMANYTYSKAVDNTTDFNSDYGPFNETDYAAERAVSDFDQRNKVVVAGVFESPWEHSKVLSGFQLSPIYAYNSGHPFNLLAGSDINGDNHFTNDRPPGAPRNSGLGPSYSNFDLRLSKQFKLGEKYSLLFTAEAFNLANHTNYASVNNIVGATFGGPTGNTFNVHGIKPGRELADGEISSPSTPLGFTAAFPAREIQLGARFNF